MKETLPWTIYFWPDGRPKCLSRKIRAAGKTFTWTYYYDSIGKFANRNSHFILTLKVMSTKHEKQYPGILGVTDEDRNFPEDYEQENGNYINKCHYCENFFRGNKHRFSCKKCENGSIEFWLKLSKKKKPEDNKCAHAGCWSEGEMTGFADCMVKKVFPLEAAYREMRAVLVRQFNICDPGTEGYLIMKKTLDKYPEL